MLLMSRSLDLWWITFRYCCHGPDDNLVTPCRVIHAGMYLNTWCKFGSMTDRYVIQINIRSLHHTTRTLGEALAPHHSKNVGDPPPPLSLLSPARTDRVSLASLAALTRDPSWRATVARNWRRAAAGSNAERFYSSTFRARIAGWVFVGRR